MSESVRTHLRVRAAELGGRNWLNTGGKSVGNSVFYADN